MRISELGVPVYSSLKQSILRNILHLNTGIFQKKNKRKFLYKELKNFNETSLCKYANCKKSADISQNVCLDDLFQNLKISHMGFFLSLNLDLII